MNSPSMVSWESSCPLNGSTLGWSKVRPASNDELRRSHFRGAPLFQLRDRIDDSELRADGQLVRSKRLARVEAVLLISRTTLSATKLAQLSGLVDANETHQLVEVLNASYDRTDSAFRIERTATGYLMMTRPALVTWLDRLHERQSQMKLSAPMMETLTIIAYQQPVTRASVEAIRGVQSSEMIRQLVDRGLVKVGGEDDSLGRPFLFVTTRQFLDMFGLGRVQDLPNFDTIGRQVAIEIQESDSENSDDAETSDLEAEDQAA